MHLQLFRKAREAGCSESSLKWEKVEHVRILRAMIWGRERETAKQMGRLKMHESESGDEVTEKEK